MLGATALSTAALTAVIEDTARQYRVEPALIKAVIKNESNWDVNASRYEAHLKDSSWGLMQVLLKTGKWMLEDDSLTISQLVTPRVNLKAGTKYLRYQLDRYGNRIKDALAAYNAGSVKRKKDGTYINQAYVDKVYRSYVQYRKEPQVIHAGMDMQFDPFLLGGAFLAIGAVVLAAR